MRKILATLLLASGPLCLAAEPSGSKYLCWPLADALDDLRNQGLKIIYSSDLVRPEMQVTTVPATTLPRQTLEELLAPHGLRVQPAANGILLVVRAAGAGPLSPPRSAHPNGGGARPAPEGEVPMALPDWTGRDLIELRFPFSGLGPGDGEPIAPQSRHLVVRLESDQFADWEQAAFALKERIVDAKSRARQLRVALEGSPETVEKLVSHGLAPYVDAYTYRRYRAVPTADPTARLWWRTAATGPDVLTQLLTAGSRGDELVVLEGPPLDVTHEAFLRRIQATLSGTLDVQPAVRGIAPERARFFLNPETGDHYLALYAIPGQSQTITFSLHRRLEARSLFPPDAPFVFFDYPDESGFILDGESSYYLFELRKKAPDAVSDALRIDSTRIIDPYEEVVRNQVFQERERKKFQSLDVMEYITHTPQNTDESQISWIHRIIYRKGHLTQYHHLAMLRNGVSDPYQNSLMGRLFRNEALLALRPLEIELDETYRYEYLGQETVDGHPTWKIRFEPLREGTVEDGTFVSGIVWLDQETNAHRKMQTYQVGLANSLIFQERTRYYEWIPSNGECFWDWRRFDGVFAANWLGRQDAYREEMLRSNFQYNRPDIDEVVRESYASDVLIHVETPPEGHRWLVKKDGKRSVGGLEYPPPAAAEPPGGAPVVAAAGAPPGSASEPAAEDPFGGRVLAGIHSFSARTYLSLGGYAWDDGPVDLYPGFVFTDNDFFDRGYQAYAGFFRREAILSLAKPNLFGKGWMLTGKLIWPYASVNNYYGVIANGKYKNLRVRTSEQSLGLSLAVPLTRRLTVNGSYALRFLRFKATAETDEDFTVPDNTIEHLVEIAADYRWRRFSAGAGVEYGQRSDWQAWGLDRSAARHDSYWVLRLLGGYFQRLGEHQSLAASLSYWKIVDGDRFSRFRDGRTRAWLAGFSPHLGFDEAVHMSIGYNFNFLRRWPIHLRLDGGQQWLDETGPGRREFLGINARFMIKGPWGVSVWPSVSYGIWSNVPGEEGHTTLGLSLSRTQ